MAQKHGPRKGTKYLGSNPYHFGQILAETRRKRGLTQEVLAERAGISRRAVTYYERETKNPTLDIVIKLAEVLRVPVTHFLPKNGNTAEEAVPDRALAKRFETAQKLPPSARGEVKKLIDTLAKSHGINE
jgi:transcriptional regulator with XRE-family HTH domain